MGINAALVRIRNTSYRMLYGGTRVQSPVAGTVASINRATPWELVGELRLQFDAHHPQGMARVGSTWWISTVDVVAREGIVFAVDGDGSLADRVLIRDEHRYHPGGMDFDGTAFWIACAEYRPHSSTTVYRMVPGAAPEPMFDVDDHVGALARCGGGGDLVG